jgi:tight adherence protein C
VRVALAWCCSVAWGAFGARPLVKRARRAAVVARLAPRVAAAPSGGVGAALRASTARLLRGSGPVGRVIGELRTRRSAQASQVALARELPVTLDLLGVAVDSGCTPYLAVETGARWAPPRMAGLFDGVLRACSLGSSFDAALDRVAVAAPALRPLVDALLVSDRLGAPVGPVLARLAVEERTTLRRRAEAHARRVPVLLLFPLAFLVLPAFVILTVVPGVASGLSRL